MDTRTQQWSDRCSGPVHRTAGLRVFYPTRSVTVLLFTLVLAPPLAVAQTPRATLDSYGDWTAYILGKSPLRVCYVETTPPSSPAGEQRLSDGRFQVTHRSLNDGFPLVRFTTKPDLSDTVILDSSRRHGLASLFAPVDPQSEGHTRFVEDMQAAEAKNAQAQMVLRSALDMARAAYSLHGFTQAYDAVRARCPPRSPEDATGPLSPSPPRRPLIAVTDLATIAGSPPPSEFSVTGPFFRAGQAEKLTIRAIPDDDAVQELEESPPESRFAYGSRHLEFYRNNTLIAVARSSYRNRVTGACLDPNSSRLKIIMNTWSGGATSLSETEALYFVPGAGIVTELLGVSTQVETFDCSDDESVWQWGGNFLACRCAGRAGKGAYYAALERLVSDLRRFGGVREESQGSISAAAFSSLLSQISELDPFVQWDALSSFEVQRLDSEKFTVVAITYKARDRHYSSDQFLFVRRLSEEFWTPVFEAPLSSKGFHTVTLHGFLDEQTLDLEMCVEDCGGWGRYARVQKDLGEWVANGAREQEAR